MQQKAMHARREKHMKMAWG